MPTNNAEPALSGAVAAWMQGLERRLQTLEKGLRLYLDSQGDPPQRTRGHRRRRSMAHGPLIRRTLRGLSGSARADQMKRLARELGYGPRQIAAAAAWGNGRLKQRLVRHTS